MARIEKLMHIALFVTLIASVVVMAFNLFSDEMWPAPKVVFALVGLCALLAFTTLLVVLTVLSRLKKYR